jgi:hypothetical protein
MHTGPVPSTEKHPGFTLYETIKNTFTNLILEIVS